ncbi:hypothetical protein BGZ96_002488 [Linnemannia gamsii]|uniref:Uncharacterized protein n=1 Tax=Linnemannia gamsii TaxID=64522 RepID=A0ABQ7JKJ1_9FUNG|nr:hypothetical protein BGZ96_002488 [Linnemannia gamsii]
MNSRYQNLTRVLAMFAVSVVILYTSAWILPVVMISGGLVNLAVDTCLSPLLNPRDKKRQLRQKEEFMALSLREDPEKGYAAAQETELGDDKGKHVEKAQHRQASVIKSCVTPGAAHGIGDFASTFYFVGAISFSSGPVIILLLKTYVFDSGWMTSRQFLVGLSLVQFLPDSNVNFAFNLGAVVMVNIVTSSLAGAIVQSSRVGSSRSGNCCENSAVKRVSRGVDACALGLIFSAV